MDVESTGFKVPLDATNGAKDAMNRGSWPYY